MYTQPLYYVDTTNVSILHLCESNSWPPYYKKKEGTQLRHAFDRESIKKQLSWHTNLVI